MQFVFRSMLFDVTPRSTMEVTLESNDSIFSNAEFVLFLFSHAVEGSAVGREW